MQILMTMRSSRVDATVVAEYVSKRRGYAFIRRQTCEFFEYFQLVCTANSLRFSSLRVTLSIK